MSIKFFWHRSAEEWSNLTHVMEEMVGKGKRLLVRLLLLHS